MTFGKLEQNKNRTKLHRQYIKKEG